MQIDTLLIGSNNIKRWHHFSQLKHMKNGHAKNTNLGISGSTTKDLIAVPYLKRIFRYCPQNVLYMAGNNDVREKINPHEIVANIRKFIVNVQNTYFSCKIAAKIVICSLIITPENQADPKEKRIIEKINDELREYCHGLQRYGIVFVNIGRGLKSEHFVNDGIHLNTAGYYYIFERLARHLY